MKGVRVGGREIVVMQKKNISLLGNRAGIILLAFLLCAGMLAGCSKDEKKNGTEDAATATVTVPASATSSPTPTVPFMKTAYETVGRNDVYRVPWSTPEGEWMTMNTMCEGEYALLWLNPAYDSVENDAVNAFLLMRPAVNAEQSFVKVEYPITGPRLLANGTVILEEQDTGRLHVLDSTLKETGSFLPSGEDGSFLLGVSEDGLLWNEDKQNGTLLATDLKGQPAGEYTIDPRYEITSYLCTEGGSKVFTAKNVSTSEILYCFLSASGELTYRDENEALLGDDWKAERIAPLSAPLNVVSDSTWFFHAPSDYRKGVAFPKATESEQVNFVRGDTMGSIEYRSNGSDPMVMGYRLYDMKQRTVSEVLYAPEIPGYFYLGMRGTVGDGIVLLEGSNEDGGSELLLWDASHTESPIAGFCDFAKDDLSECLAALLKEAEGYGIVITPDRTTDDGTLTSLGDFMAEIEFVNSFLITAKNDPELLKTSNGDAIRPENMRNNDGATYTFNPHVFSKFYTKEHGEKRRDAFFAYVDAVRAGEDRYRCTEGDAAWSSGRFALMFFPYAGLYVDAEYTGDGWADIIYKIPKEEFLAKEREFEARIEEILNNILEDDYTDFEKALALYEFVTEYTVYDYEMMEHNGEEEWNVKQSAYRVLDEQQGICGEIAILYQYLGLQCGIDVDEVVGAPFEYGADSHAWNYICLDGTGYLIDATWGLTERRKPDLKYFLFTDELRETRDGYDSASYDVGFNGMYGARKKFSFECEDERYADLWEGTYVAFDEEQNCIFYRDLNGSMKRFEYGE